MSLHDTVTGILKWQRSETSRCRLTTFKLSLLRSTFKVVGKAKVMKSNLYSFWYRC